MYVMVSARLVNSSFSPTSHLLVYYRIYAEDGAIPSETPVAHGDPFLGRINARYVPPPHTAKAVKRSISKVENFKDCTITSLFLTPYTQSPIGDADEITILNCTGPGSTPQEPLALVAKISESERSALESGGRDELASAQVAEPPEIRYRTSIQQSPIFLFRLLGGSVLSALRRRLYKAIESSHWSRGAVPWSYPRWFCCAAT